MEEKPIRVLLVDDHAAMRAGLATFLGIFSDMELVGEAANGVEALALCSEKNPDVVLMDLVMPKMDGIAAMRAIQTQYPHIRVIALTSFKEQDQVQAVLAAGALGYLLKDIPAQDLARAIRTVMAGQVTLAPEVLHSLATASAPWRGNPFSLTRREVEVLECIGRGLNNSEIAQELVLSRNTVKTHVRSILTKLDVSNRIEAITLSLEHGLIKPSHPLD